MMAWELNEIKMKEKEKETIRTGQMDCMQHNDYDDYQAWDDCPGYNNCDAQHDRPGYNNLDDFDAVDAIHIS